MKKLPLIIGLILSCQILTCQTDTIYFKDLDSLHYVPFFPSYPRSVDYPLPFMPGYPKNMNLDHIPFMPGGPPFNNTIVIDTTHWSGYRMETVKILNISHFLLEYPEGTLDLKVNFDTSKYYDWNFDFSKIEYRKEDLVIIGDTVAIILYILKEWKDEIDKFDSLIQELKEIYGINQ